MNTIYQVTAEDLKTFGREILQEALESKAQNKTLTVGEYAKEYGIGRQTVMIHLRNGKLKGHKIGKFWRIEVEG